MADKSKYGDAPSQPQKLRRDGHGLWLFCVVLAWVAVTLTVHAELEHLQAVLDNQRLAGESGIKFMILMVLGSPFVLSTAFVTWVRRARINWWQRVAGLAPLVIYGVVILVNVFAEQERLSQEHKVERQRSLAPLS